MEKADCNNFLRIIKNPASNPNAFIRFNYFNEISKSYKFNYFGPNEDLYEFEITCNICLGRVCAACRPNKCYHIFCRPCLKKWHKFSQKCPVCRTLFEYIEKVDYQESWVKLRYC